jgi:2-polyprenyl-3-methyl-5-hydroxy-6-metoxy-1,4-benzoquinol methylase
MRNIGFTNVIKFDLTNIEEFNFFPDVIVLGDTIEHLTCMDVLFRNIYKIMSKNKNSELLISTPNAFYFKNFLKSLMMTENTHKDHKLYFSPQTLSLLLDMQGFTIEEMVFTFLNRKQESIVKKIVKLFLRYFPMLSETIVIRCKLKQSI